MAGEASRPTGVLKIILGVLKGGSIVVGLPLTVLSLMALVGVFTANGWARSIIAAVVALGLPLVLVEKLLPDEDQARAKGLFTDMLAILWIAIPLLFVGLAHGVTGKLIAREGDRLAAAGYESLATASYWLAAAEPVAPKPSPVKAPKKGAGKGSGSAKAVAKDAGPPDAKKADAAPKDGAPGDAKPDGGATAKKKKRRKFTPAELFNECAPSIVSIRIMRGGGTGFLVDDKGTIATNSHVIHKATDVQIKLKNGTWIKSVDLLAEDKEADLALLRVKLPKPLPPLVLGDSDKVTVGERIVSIGNPLGLEHTLTDGLLSARRVYRGRKWIQVTTPISPGNSGGPLFNMHGEVVAISTRVVAWFRAQNLNLGVPVNVLKKMITGKYPKRRSIGVNKAQTW